MHGQGQESRTPRVSMTLAHLAGVSIGGWFLAGDGFTLRETIVFGCGVIYFLRYLLTSFVLLQRAVRWPEVVQVGPFLFAVQGTFGYLASRSAIAWRWLDWVALVLFALGSFLNTASELERRRWKRAPQHKGRLYTQGLFSLSMHINYFGDTILFTGFALLAASPWALAIPLLMTCLFLTVHIPTLDRYLSEKYPTEFDEWAKRTKKFVPFVY